ncbi:MAG TPA: CDF family Co(II)/Ni(II) efflux transporter DmeF [Methylibium sp.]|uniref:CDF family Co(II)/Ni(II) efflux transporter DmeF n=1 Tax=Methylibium sp. TaxID=2067992 RepID=UPI002DBDB986|nr:CDF family Co(II)/Ni(II) efflux transporter DmeF [Methylibium sp.]HEU4458383.1 CDF family Co(II)/Ni(II) efflux transporter DmeF [Methylibium sp.]
MADHAPEHTHDLSPWQHAHAFGADRGASERRTRWVIAITLATMVAEIGAGMWWHSMALLADGWHMGTHAAAIGVAALSYALARRWAGDARFSLGPWKVEVLGAYTSAVLLGVVALGIAVESALRLWTPQAVAYDESLLVAGLGLVVNAVCAKLLHAGHGHGQAHAAAHRHAHGPASHDGAAHDHEHQHQHEPPHADDHGADLNLRAAYLHVLADAATSVLAIAALLAGKFFAWTWLDPAVGLLGAVLIAVWSIGLLRRTSTILLDREMDDPVADRVRERLEADGDARVADLHLSRVSDTCFSAHVTLVADVPLSADVYRERLRDIPSLAHVSVEVNRCRGSERADARVSACKPAKVEPG